jgi:hypothetical protein
MSGGSSVPPREVADHLAYFSGVIEGKAARVRAQAAIAARDIAEDGPAV